MKKTCWVALGSNMGKISLIEDTITLLKSHFNAVCISSIQRTLPLNFSNPAPFYNVMIRFKTHLTATKVIQTLKTIECEMGRLPEDKANGIVVIDIDLLIYKSQHLRITEEQREYIKNGIKEIRNRKC